MRKFQDFITLACILVFIIITSRELGEQIFYRDYFRFSSHQKLSHFTRIVQLYENISGIYIYI